MKLRRVAILGLGIVLLALIATSILARREAEPTVKGVPISKWLRSPGTWVPGEAAEAGTNAIPLLARALRTRNVIPYQWSVRVWRALPARLQRRVSQPMPASEVRQRALSVLREFGPEAEPVLGAVMEVATKDSDVMTRQYARSAAVAINAYHPQVLALLERHLRSSNPAFINEAWSALYAAGVFPPSLTNFIVLNRNDPRRAYWNELVALGGLGDQIEPFMPRILPFLSDESTRGNALVAIERSGPHAVAAVPTLVACLGGTGHNARSRPIGVLMRIGPAAKEAVPALEVAMRDKEVVTRVLAAAARCRITGDAAASAPVILDALEARDDDSGWPLPKGAFGLDNYGFNSRMTALWFAGELGRAATNGLPVLIQRMQNGRDWDKVVAARSVWKIEGALDRALPVLKTCLASADENTRVLACYILGEIGPPAAALVPDPEKAERTTLATRRAALAAIKKIRQKPGS